MKKKRNKKEKKEEKNEKKMKKKQEKKRICDAKIVWKLKKSYFSQFFSENCKKSNFRQI